MVKSNADFFDAKSEWAFLKDDLLTHYLEPYLAKILTTGRHLLYVDGFAGKGMFMDGQPGSPVIACRSIEQALKRNRSGNRGVTALFVEKNYASDLRKNVSAFDFALVHQGSYTELSEKLLDKAFRHSNLFMYVDPYGVKNLDMCFLVSVSKVFSSVEILINLNTFGFFRAACAVYDVSYDDAERSDYLIERDSGAEDSPNEASHRLTVAAGGDYWKDIVSDYRAGVIDGRQAENQFAIEYCARLRSAYSYVQDLPIRIKEHNHPKYRMVHATNHPAGCLIMYDSMYARLIDMKSVQHGGQTQLFLSDDVGDYIDADEEEERLKRYLEELGSFVLLEQALAEYVSKTGLTLPLKELRALIRGFEKSGIVEIRRSPSVTTSGMPSRFMESKSGKTVEVRGRYV